MGPVECPSIAPVAAHTTYSDGKSTVEEMAEQAAELGYEYISLTDHSPSQRIAHGLDLGRLDQEIEEIERLRTRRRTKALHILIGAEFDILGDGKLDYPDEILERLDIVADRKSDCTEVQGDSRILTFFLAPVRSSLGPHPKCLLPRRFAQPWLLWRDGFSVSLTPVYN